MARGDVSLPPRNNADLAQARLFVHILEVEIADLEARVESAEERWMKRHRTDYDTIDPPDALVRLQRRLDEARRLSQALRKRFPSK
jgi:hypothetical protein